MEKLTPTPPRRRRLADLPDLLRSLPRLGPEEAEALSEDLGRIRTASNREEPGDAWES